MNNLEDLKFAHKAADNIWNKLDNNSKIATYLAICTWNATSWGAIVCSNAPCLISFKEYKFHLYKDKALYPIPSTSFPRILNRNIFEILDKSEYLFDECDKDNQLLMKELEKQDLHMKFLSEATKIVQNYWELATIPLKQKADIALKLLEQKLGNPLIKLEIWKFAVYPEGYTYETYNDD